MKPFIKYSLILLSVLALIAAILISIYADHEWLKRIDSISTIVLAFLTAGYVIVTYSILRSTRPQPHVFVSLPTDDEDFRVFLSIKNMGNRPAYNVHITFEPSLDILAPTPQFKGAAGPMLNQPFMPPEAEVRNFLSSSLQVHALPDDKKRFKVQLSYKDSQRRKFADTYHIDLGSYIFEKKFHSPKKSDN